MSALFTVEKCLDPALPPGPDLRHAKYNDDDNYDYNYEDTFNTISIQPKKPQVQARSSRGGQFKIWRHYIAIEEVTWDYAPHLKHTDR